jgi:hypothetical protein
MNEQDKFDDLLSKMMSSAPQPRLSANFQKRLTRRLHGPTLNLIDRSVVSIYAFVAILFSIWLMRSESINWSIVAASIALPLILVEIVRRKLA